MGENAFPQYSLRFESTFQFDLVLLQTELSRVAHITAWARQMLGLDVGWVAFGKASPQLQWEEVGVSVAYRGPRLVWEQKGVEGVGVMAE